MTLDPSKAERARILAGLTKAELARRVLISSSTLSDYLNGTLGSPPVMKRIALELNIPLEKLLANWKKVKG